MADTKKTDKTPAVRALDWGDVLDRWFADWPMARALPELRRRFGEEMELLKVEEFTEGDEFVVRAEMPGLDPDKDVEITVGDHMLRMRAERHEESETKDKDSYRSEFRYGSFTRTLALPAGATDKDVKATYKDGILEVRVPIDRKEATANKIPVQRA